MSRSLPMPEVATGVTEAVLARWYVSPGQAFAKGDALAMVETDKASIDVSAEEDAVLLRHLAVPGTTVRVGDDIALIGHEGEVAVDAPAGQTAQPEVTTPRGVPPAPEAGQIPVAHAGAADPAASDFEAIPHSRMRKAIARALVESTNTVPHFYLRARVKVDQLLTLRAQLNAVEGVKVSINDLVVKAAARALILVPEMNVTWTNEAVRRYRTADIAIAVSTDTGLLTPVVRGAESLGVSELSRRIKTLVARVASGDLKQHELEGGSFTISNLGMFGVREFDAIINPPHAGILAVGAAQPEPIVVDGVVQAATVMHVTLSVDHRPVDGVVGAKWLATFVEIMEEPFTRLV